MKKLLPVCILAFISAFNIFSQENNAHYSLLLKSGTYSLPENLEDVITASAVHKSETVNGKYYRFMQFYQIPTDEKKKELEKTGITFLCYIPNHTYIVSVPTNYELAQLREYGVRSVSCMGPEHKLSLQLFNKDYPSHAITNGNKIDLNIVYFSDISSEYVSEKLISFGTEILSVGKHFPHITVRIGIIGIEELAKKPFVQYLEVIDPPGEPENLVGKTNHRSNAISTDYGAGRQYDGSGINVMLQDDGIIGPHIDYQGRIGAQYVTFNNGDHGDHVAGTIFGAGNLDPTARGMAHGADLYVYGAATQNYPGFDSIYNHYTNPGTLISSTSYSNGCNAGYTSLTQKLDQQIRQMPSLIHVFSAGNTGTSDCSYGAGAGWGNITGGHKQGKNVIAVGNLDSLDVLNSSSSRGPAHDGRVKPDVCAVGTNVNSTMDPNSYQVLTGTSMSCPGVSGTMAQLYHAYRDLNSGQDPPSALMKAVLLNSADDLGNSGPDYRFGYGRINGLRAVKYLEDGRYLSDTISQGGNNLHNILVPMGTAQLRVMLYWHDYEGAVNANPALVNNLDMVVMDPSNASFSPWVLDPTPNAATLNLPATRQVDNLNNVEQVTIDTPSVGNYTINISGTLVPQGPQQYSIVYEFVRDEITVTYPNGGEGFQQGGTETIRWDAFGTIGTFNVEYSTDNGSTWNTINASVSGAQRYYNWTVPTTAPTTGQALIRVSRGAASDISDANFSLIRIPFNLSVDTACPASFRLRWDMVTGATGYEVSMLGPKYMDSVGTTSNTYWWFTGTNPNNTYWVSVRALGPLWAEGRRALAYEKTPGVWNCTSAIDAALTSVTNPSTGTTPDCQNLSSVPVIVVIENLGTTSISNVSVSYQINAGPAVNETYTGTLAPSATANYTFTATANLSSPGIYNVTSWVTYNLDGNIFNDTSYAIVNVVSLPTVALPWTEDFETFTLCGTASDCGATVCTLANGWSNAPNGSEDNIDWRTDEGGTPSANTGPAIDHAPGTATGNYLYTEASNCFNNEGDMITPCIDLTTAISAQFSLWYHMYGAAMGVMHLDVLSNGVWTNDAMPILSGDKGNTWFQQLVDLTPYVGGKINLRFRGITGSSFTSDMAIDDINLTAVVSVNENSSGGSFWVYPNPVKNVINIQLNNLSANGKLFLKMRDVTGRLIYSDERRNTATIFNTQIDVTRFASGIYSLELLSGDKQYRTLVCIWEQ